jgi:predicted amidohydrolase YtcJ
VARTRPDGTPAGGWRPDQALTLDQALQAYTLGPALAAGLEARQGSLAKGKLADLVVLDQDLFGLDPLAWPGVKAEMTMVGGRVTFDRWGRKV